MADLNWDAINAVAAVTAAVMATATALVGGALVFLRYREFQTLRNPLEIYVSKKYPLRAVEVLFLNRDPRPEIHIKASLEKTGNQARIAIGEEPPLYPYEPSFAYEAWTGHTSTVEGAMAYRQGDRCWYAPLLMEEPTQRGYLVIELLRTDSPRPVWRRRFKLKHLNELERKRRNDPPPWEPR